VFPQYACCAWFRHPPAGGIMNRMKPTVYVETSVVSAYDDPREDIASQRQRLLTVDWWEHQRSYFELYGSLAVLDELQQADFPGRKIAVKLVGGMTMLPITPEVEGVAKVYRRHFAMPDEPLGDALHLAVASVNEMDYLLTWNCKHLANTNKARHVQAINMRMGLLTPVMLTPEMLIAEEHAE
jgi:hypothetical protein